MWDYWSKIVASCVGTKVGARYYLGMRNTQHGPECIGTDCYCDEIPTMSYEEAVKRAERDKLTFELVRAARLSNKAPTKRKNSRVPVRPRSR